MHCWCSCGWEGWAWNRSDTATHICSLVISLLIVIIKLNTVASWHKRLGTHLPLLGSRVRISVTQSGFRGGRNGVWEGFSRGFSRFPLPQISFHHFSTLISSISFHFICPCDGATGVVGRHPCYSQTYNMGASSHLIPRPDLVLDTSWGYLLIYYLIYVFFLNHSLNFMFFPKNCIKFLGYVLYIGASHTPEITVSYM